MDISTALVTIAFLGLPGLIASKVYRKLRGRTKKKNWEDFTEILLFATLSYLILGFVFCLFPRLSPEWKPQPASAQPATAPAIAATPKDLLPSQQHVLPGICVLDRLFDDDKHNDDKHKLPTDWHVLSLEIAYASIVGILVSFGGSAFHYKKCLSRIARRFKCTRRFGDEDLWEFFHDSPDTIWINVRDHKLDLIYSGAVTQYSESEQDRELIISSVSVYDKNGQLLYDTPALYICREKDDLSLELPSPEQYIKSEPPEEKSNAADRRATNAAED